jgi:hypothetical protein
LHSNFCTRWVQSGFDADRVFLKLVALLLYFYEGAKFVGGAEQAIDWYRTITAGERRS